MNSIKIVLSVSLLVSQLLCFSAISSEPNNNNEPQGAQPAPLVRQGTKPSEWRKLVKNPRTTKAVVLKPVAPQSAPTKQTAGQQAIANGEPSLVLPTVKEVNGLDKLGDADINFINWNFTTPKGLIGAKVTRLARIEFFKEKSFYTVLVYLNEDGSVEKRLQLSLADSSKFNIGPNCQPNAPFSKSKWDEKVILPLNSDSFPDGVGLICTGTPKQREDSGFAIVDPAIQQRLLDAANENYKRLKELGIQTKTYNLIEGELKSALNNQSVSQLTDEQKKEVDQAFTNYEKAIDAAIQGKNESEQIIYHNEFGRVMQICFNEGNYTLNCYNELVPSYKRLTGKPGSSQAAGPTQ